MKQHEMAIIGYGGMGAWHAYNQQNRQEFRVRGVYDIRPERMEQAKKDGYETYESFEAALQDAEVELVLIATPNDSHKPLALSAMRAGKDVLLEKPAVMFSADLEELMREAKSLSRLLTVHQNRRWDTDYLMVKEIADKNLLGKPYMLESRVQGSRRILAGWRGYLQNGGGMTYDWGVHLLDQLLQLKKEPVTEVYGQLFRVFAPEADDNFKAVIRFADKTSALVEVSMNCFIKHPRWHVSCENGTAVIQDWDCSGHMVRLINDEELAWQEDIVYTPAGPTRSMAPRPPETVEEAPLPQVEADRYGIFRNIAAAMEKKEELIVQPAQVLRVLKVIEAIFASDKAGQSIACNI